MKTKKKILSIIMAIAFIIGTPPVEDTAYAEGEATTNKAIEVLFIGNSLTHRNSMPSILEGIAEANGVNVNATPLTYSGYFLSSFADPENDYGKQLRDYLANNSYDFVVIQAQSTETLTMFEESTIPSASTIANLIRANGAEPIMYMTWAYKYNCTYEKDGKSHTIDNPTMTEKLTENYYKLGNELGAKVAPAGQNFKRYSELFPNIELYNKDEFHPSYTGSYLAACTLYNTIFEDYHFSDDEEENTAKQTCLGCPYYKTDEVDISISKETASNCQMVADVKLNDHASYVSIPVGGTSRYNASISVSKTNELYNSIFENGDKITYSSLDDSIVSIDKNTGKFKALAAGSTLVKATSASGLSTLQTVQVRQPATGIKINEKNVKLCVGDTTKLTATVLPANATEKDITWTSSNPSVATVVNGTISAITTGTATITARTHNGYTAQTTITVALKVPTNLTITNTTSAKGDNYTNLVLNWNNVLKASRYIVYRSTSASGTYKKVATVENTTYTDSNLKAGNKYFYKVYASCGVLAYKSDESKTASYIVPTKAVLNSAIRTNASKKKYIKLSWTAQNEANGYMIYRANTKNGKYKLIKTITRNTKTIFTDKTTKKKKKYFYKICAYAKNNGTNTCGAFSEKVRVKKATK